MVNRDFDGVIDGCAEPKRDRARTWINGRIRRIYRALFEHGHCHSVEVYDGAELVGGLYGVSLGRAFFGESMFHRARDASKIALVHLVARLRAGGYRLLDTQFVTDHLRTFGAVEVPQAALSPAAGRRAHRRRATSARSRSIARCRGARGAGTLGQCAERAEFAEAAVVRLLAQRAAGTLPAAAGAAAGALALAARGCRAAVRGGPAARLRRARRFAPPPGSAPPLQSVSHTS